MLFEVLNTGIDEIRGLNADLPSHAASRNGYKHGRLPTVFLVPDNHHPMTPPNAHHKAAFDQFRDHHDSLGVGQQRRRNSLADFMISFNTWQESSTMAV